MTLFCTSKNAQNDTQFNVDFWRENSNTFALKLYIVRIASNVVKGDFKSNFQIHTFVWHYFWWFSLLCKSRMKKEVAKSCLFIYSSEACSLREAFIKLGIIFAALKIVVVADGNAGKTSMLSSYCKDRFSMAYQPTGEIIN